MSHFDVRKQGQNSRVDTDGLQSWAGQDFHRPQGDIRFVQSDPEASLSGLGIHQLNADHSLAT